MLTSVLVVSKRAFPLEGGSTETDEKKMSNLYHDDAIYDVYICGGGEAYRPVDEPVCVPAPRRRFLARPSLHGAGITWSTQHEKREVPIAQNHVSAVDNTQNREPTNEDFPVICS